MSPKAYVRPGKMASVIGIIAASVMLIFGIVFFGLLLEEGSGIGQIFVAFWMLIVILMIAYYVHNLKSGKASSSAMAEIDLEMPESGPTVEEKLRSLERLKKDRLITEEEYLQKRKEIMQQKW
jgi:amino acid permease